MFPVPTFFQRPTVTRTIVFFLLFCIGGACPASLMGEELKKTVLYLNSYHNGYQWSDGLLEGVRSVLTKSKYRVDFQIEYMDAKKFDYEAIAPNLFQLYKQKFADENFDAIILSDNDALNFVNSYHEELFPGVPVVFCGINDLRPADTERGNITGVVEFFDLVSTLKLARKLHPKRDRLVVLIDDSTAGRGIMQQIQNITKQNNLDLKIDYWIQLSLEEAQRRVYRLNDDAFLFIAPYYQTIDGQFYTSEEVSEAISRYSSVPIYTAWEFMVGYGALGGKVLSAKRHGTIAGKMALKILDGTPARDIPILREPGGIYMFDYNVLHRLGIDQRELPENSKIINRPKTIYSLSRELFWTIMISFILLLLALVSMVGAMVERKKVERKITEQLAFQETLMDTIPQLVSWKDSNGRYLGANQAFIDFFMISETRQVMGLATEQLVSDSNYSDWSVSADQGVIRSNHPLRKVRKKVTRLDDSEAWLEVNKVPLIGQGGRTVGVLSTAENITKEQNLEKQLLQSQKMEAIGTLAGGIAHDFNNILTSIINSTELAITDVEPDSATEADLLRVLKAARRGARVVQQILSFSRPSREGFRPTEMKSVVAEVIHLLSASMPANISVSAITDIPEEAKQQYIVNADPTQMHQAILNLCTNAFHALRQNGGNITIELGMLTLEEARDLLPEQETGGCVRLSVLDDGPGIPEDILDKIFDPFFSTKNKAEGTGLGLAVVHGIVQSHGGTILVRSEPDLGTTFDIILPASTEGAGPLPLDIISTPSMGGRILFIEDDEDQLQTAPRLLEEMGFKVTGQRDPKRALEMITADPGAYDVIITDFDMPGMSGTTLAEHVPTLPVILISGREDARTAAETIPNIHRVFIKPYEREELCEAINTLLLR